MRGRERERHRDREVEGRGVEERGRKGERKRERERERNVAGQITVWTLVRTTSYPHAPQTAQRRKRQSSETK